MKTISIKQQPYLSVHLRDFIQPWQARICEGGGGLKSVLFSPDSRHLFAHSEFDVKVTIWSLESMQVSHTQLKPLHS